MHGLKVVYKLNRTLILEYFIEKLEKYVLPFEDVY